MALILPHSVFIHVPKTGGTWCREALRAAGIPLFESGPTESRIRQIHASAPDAYPTASIADWRSGDDQPRERMMFGFVREPMAWLGSVWSYAYQRGCRPGDSPTYKDGLTPWLFPHLCTSFEHFIDRLIEDDPCVPSTTMLPLLGYVYDGEWKEGEHLVSFVGHQESLEADLLEALTIAGEEFDPARMLRIEPKRVASKLPEYASQITWRPDQKRKLYDANSFLCDKFGYEE